MGEGAKESFKDARSNIGEKRQGTAVNYYYVRQNQLIDDRLFNLEAEKSLKEAEAEAPKKGKGLMGTIRDWVAPAAEKTKGLS